MRAYFVLPLAKTAEGIDLRGRDSSARKIPRSKLLRIRKNPAANAAGFFGRILAPRPWAFLTCDSSRNDSCAPTKNTDGKTPSDIFMSACPHPSPLGCLLAWFYAVSRISARCQRASITLPRATFHACATRKHFTRRSNDRRISCLRDSADISPPGAACPVVLALGLIWAWLW